MRCLRSAIYPRVVASLRRGVAALAPDLTASRAEAEALAAEVVRLEQRLTDVLTQLDELVDRMAATGP